MATVDQFVAAHPRVFHMAEQGTWPNIQSHGLLSTTALLDLFEIKDQKRTKLESTWRPSSVTIQHPLYGAAVIRDQKPMPPPSLHTVLTDMTTQQWYELLNRKSFFWVTEDRLKRLLKASLYKYRPHVVLTIDSGSLIERDFEGITLSPMNSGVSAFGRPPKRGSNTFKPFAECNTFDCQNAVELAVDYHVPHVADLTLSVATWQGDKLLETVWEP